MTTPTNPPLRPSVLLVHVERECAETAAHAHAKVPVLSGALAECLHQFLDIDADLRGRDYTQSGRRP